MKNKILSVSSIIKKQFVLILILLSPLTTIKCIAQDDEEPMKEAIIALSFNQNDTERICTATVTSNGMPVIEKEIYFYVKRMYSLLPIEGSVETDEEGVATQMFPLDLPGDEKGNLIVVAKIDEDDDFGTVTAEAPVKWGVMPAGEEEVWGMRSLAASRDKAPMILILVSNAIIALIWGTIFFVIYQIVRIGKASTIVKIKKK